MHHGALMRYAAFTTNPAGGNPAGVWVGDQLPPREEMQAIAKRVGYSETAFIAPATGSHRTVRYFSPEMEVTFCGHATIASGVALATLSGSQSFVFSTLAGDIPVAVALEGGRYQASLTSVEPGISAASEDLVARALGILGWRPDDMDPTIPPVIAYAGARHLLLAVRELERLNAMSYEFEPLRAEMEREELTTLQLVFRESDTVFHARNPFPVGGVVEDPATGAAAAALGGYLREAHLISVPATISIYQGHAMGRPATLTVNIPAAGGIVVSGAAVEIPE